MCGSRTRIVSYSQCATEQHEEACHGTKQAPANIHGCSFGELTMVQWVPRQNTLGACLAAAIIRSGEVRTADDADDDPEYSHSKAHEKKQDHPGEA